MRIRIIDGDTMNITSRPARADDTEFCRRVHHLAYRDVVLRQFGGWDASQQDGFFAEGWDELQFQIIEADGQSVGCYCCEAQPEQVFLHEISLLPTFQGRGIGAELIKREQGGAARLGVPMRLRVLKENHARRLYRRLGFRETEEDATHLRMEWTGVFLADR